MTRLIREANGLTIEAHDIIGTDLMIYSAWEPSCWLPEGGHAHSSLQHIDGVLMGRVGMRRLPAALEALPAFSDARLTAVQAWEGEQEHEAYAAIVAAFPEAAFGRRSSGEISLSAVARFAEERMRTRSYERTQEPWL